ncbi:hypothetical protein P6O77_15605, partial [Clostridium perfringens]|nr:hypothetical protein [Clostridium perfringens]
MKRLLFVFSMLLIASMVLGACATPTEAPAPADVPPAAAPTDVPAAEVPTTPPPAEGKTVLNVWSFTNEI